MNKKIKPQPVPEVLTEYIKVKEEYQEQYERKKATQRNAQERRQFIRDLKEDREWS